MPPVKTSWQAWVALAVTVSGFAWGLASGWFSLEKRVTLIEERERYSHGDVTPYLKEK